jgi:tetratricopeptide (TPR) repeat protein
MAQVRRPTPTIAEAKRLFEQGLPLAARGMAEAILKAQPRSVDAMVLLALMARTRGELAEVDRLTRSALQVKPHDRYVRLMHAQNFLHMGEPASAIAACDEALTIFAGDADFLLLRAMAHEARFEYQKALACVDGLLKDPNPRADVYALAGRALHGLGRYEEAIKCMLGAATNLRHPADDRRRLWFLLFKTYDRMCEYDRAMDACAKAHAAQPATFDPVAFGRLIDDLMSVFSGSSLRTLARSQVQSDVPVFVVGMPRSGTTLVEQIIHAHPQAFGAGELPDIDNIARALTTETASIYPYPAAAADLSAETATRLGAMYLERLRELGGAASRIANKMPHDYQHVGLIWQLLPGARIIHTLRDPLDTCLSCYTRQLSLTAIPYAGSLEHLGFVYRQHERLMNHWKAALDLPILTVQYEDLVADQERITRQIIDFLGLPWDDRCLRYWEKEGTDRTVMTLSYDQVNKPIYDSSIGRWRNYEKHLGPLKRALGMEI